MSILKFNEFLKNRKLSENQQALEYDRNMATYRNRFGDMPSQEVEKIIQAAGYHTIPQFIADKNDAKWQKLRMPGQENFAKK